MSTRKITKLNENDPERIYVKRERLASIGKNPHLKEDDACHKYCRQEGR